MTGDPDARPVTRIVYADQLAAEAIRTCQDGEDVVVVRAGLTRAERREAINRVLHPDQVPAAVPRAVLGAMTAGGEVAPDTATKPMPVMWTHGWLLDEAAEVVAARVPPRVRGTVARFGVWAVVAAVAVAFAVGGALTVALSGSHSLRWRPSLPPSAGATATPVTVAHHPDVAAPRRAAPAGALAASTVTGHTLPPSATPHHRHSRGAGHDHPKHDAHGQDRGHGGRHARRRRHSAKATP